jgi:hypothetical protein
MFAIPPRSRRKRLRYPPQQGARPPARYPQGYPAPSSVEFCHAKLQKQGGALRRGLSPPRSLSPPRVLIQTL